MHILRFIKNKAAWDAPKTPEDRAALRNEALYFGCMALVERLDALEEDREAGVAGPASLQLLT